MNNYERQRWLEERRKGVGASESAAVLDRSPWSTSLEVWARKVGRLDEKQPTEPMKWGLRLEEAIASAYEEETGHALSPCDEVQQHADYPFMLASLDRICDSTRRVVELKAVGPWVQKEWGDAGSDDIPEHVILQVQQQMAVAELDKADVAALFSGQDFRIYTVRREDHLIEFLAQKEAEFWDMVLAKRQPEPNWSHKSTPQLIRALYGVVDESKEIDMPLEAEADYDLQEWISVFVETFKLPLTSVDAFDLLGTLGSECKERRELIQAQLLHAMGTAALAYLPDGSMLTRKEVDRKAYHVDACSYIDFRHKKLKAKV